jgi:hypothetical protein
MNNAVFWDVTLYGSCENQRFKGTYLLHHQGEKKELISFSQLLVTAVVLTSRILSALMMDTIPSSETSVLTRATRRHIPEDVIFRSDLWPALDWTRLQVCVWLLCMKK